MLGAGGWAGRVDLPLSDGGFSGHLPRIHLQYCFRQPSEFNAPDSSCAMIWGCLRSSPRATRSTNCGARRRARSPRNGERKILRTGERASTQERFGERTAEPRSGRATPTSFSTHACGTHLVICMPDRWLAACFGMNTWITRIGSRYKMEQQQQHAQT